MKKPVAKLIGKDGNIFNLAAIARRALKHAGQDEKVKEMNDRVFTSGSYDEALRIIGEYVRIK